MPKLSNAWFALRVTALLTGWAGLIGSVSVMGQRVAVPAPIVGGALFLAAFGAYVSVRPAEPDWARVSKFVRVMWLGIAFLTLAIVAQSESGTPIEALATFAACVYLAHAYAQRTLRDVLVGVVISLFMSVLPLATSTDRHLSVLLVLCWLGAVTAVVLAHHIGHQEGAAVVAARHQSVAVDGANPALAMTRAVALAMVLGFLVFLILPQPNGDGARRGLAQRGGSRFGRSPDAGAARRGATFYSGGDLELRARGKLPDTPVLDVPADSPGLWRGATLDTYQRSTWTKNDPPLFAVPTGSAYQVSPDPTSVGLPARQVRDDQVHVYGPWLLLVAPGQPERVATAAHIENGPAGPMLVGFDREVAPEADIEYVVRSTSTEVGSAAAVATGADPSDPRWTALPVLPARVYALAQSLASPAGDRLQTLRAIENDLRARATYRLDPPVPSAKKDAVDHFLFDSRTGFCEHFASAEVVLLRSLGIPARLVTGFAGGEPIGDGRRMMRASNAHAWVEVWLPGVGWVSSDPTAGTRRADETKGWLSRLMSAIAKAFSSARGRLLIALGVIVLCLCAWGAWWLRRRRRRPRPVRQALLGGGPLWAALARLEVALAATGQPSPPAETLSELGGRLSCGPDETNAFGVLERLCYSGTPPSQQEEHQAAAAFDAIAARLLSEAATKAGTVS